MTTEKNYETIYKEIENLENEKKESLNLLKKIEQDITNTDIKIRKLMTKFPNCYSCGNYRYPKNMIIATQDDINEYYDQNEGYNGPEVGEYYCGC